VETPDFAAVSGLYATIFNRRLRIEMSAAILVGPTRRKWCRLEASRRKAANEPAIHADIQTCSIISLMRIEEPDVDGGR
jgi:hypothetical protein